MLHKLLSSSGNFGCFPKLITMGQHWNTNSRVGNFCCWHPGPWGSCPCWHIKCTSPSRCLLTKIALTPDNPRSSLSHARSTNQSTHLPLKLPFWRIHGNRKRPRPLARSRSLGTSRNLGGSSISSSPSTPLIQEPNQLSKLTSFFRRCTFTLPSVAEDHWTTKSRIGLFHFQQALKQKAWLAPISILPTWQQTYWEWTKFMSTRVVQLCKEERNPRQDHIYHHVVVRKKSSSRHNSLTSFILHVDLIHGL